MDVPSTHAASRRRFLKLTGGGLALIPLVNLYGCGGEEPARPAAPKPEASRPESAMPKPARPEAMQESMPKPSAPATSQTAQPQTPAGDLQELSEDDPMAKALGYVHEADKVDASKYPRYEKGHTCANCSLYDETAGEDGWGSCTIFVGKLVKAEGWCNSYVPKA